MATTSPTTHENPPHLEEDHRIDFNLSKEGRKFGIILGLLTSAYLIIVNAVFVELPINWRFAKHLLIIPVLWYAASSYAKSVPTGEIFKGEVSLFIRIGMWAAAILVGLNIVLSAIDPEIGFEQFFNDNNSFGDVMMNSFFVAVETLVFVLIIGWSFLQYYKRGGSPED